MFERIRQRRRRRHQRRLVKRMRAMAPRAATREMAETIRQLADEIEQLPDEHLAAHEADLVRALDMIRESGRDIEVTHVLAATVAAVVLAKVA